MFVNSAMATAASLKSEQNPRRMSSVLYYISTYFLFLTQTQIETIQNIHSLKRTWTHTSTRINACINTHIHIAKRGNTDYTACSTPLHNVQLNLDIL